MGSPEGRWAPGTLLDRLGNELVAQLVALGALRRFTEGERIIRQGDSDKQVYVLLTGVVKVLASAANGREVLLAVRIAGDVVGEIAAADGKPRTATVVSCGSVTALFVPVSVWSSFLSGSPSASVALNGVLGARFRVETDRRVEFAEMSAPVRIARVLDTFLRSYGRITPRGRELLFPLSQSELAAAADCAIASVQSTLREMREQGLVDTHRRRLVFRDVDALSRWPMAE